jgi:predicted negative regulator of RcsB-dependent stress response
MKKNLISIFVVVAIAMVAGWNVMQSQSNEALSDVALANVEALADEGGSIACRQSLDRPYEYCNIHTTGIYCPCGW